MIDFLALVAAASAGGGFTWVGQTATGYFKSRNDRVDAQTTNDFAMMQHRDKLTFELLHAAREEVMAARVETVELRSLQLRLIHFEEALNHIDALLKADDEESRAMVERSAMQFLTRMKRYQEAAGAMRNEAQVQMSREAKEILDKGLGNG